MPMSSPQMTRMLGGLPPLVPSALAVFAAFAFALFAMSRLLLVEGL